jgi:CheY-like chemotaxis protein
MLQVVAVVDDLLFQSRIREAVRRAGGGLRVLTRPADVPGVLATDTRLVVVDADSDRLPWPGIIRRIRSEPGLESVPVVAFVSHADAARAAAAREAGATRVMARSAFVQQLPALLVPARREEETT